MRYWCGMGCFTAMIKLLIWLAGDCALLYAIDRMGLWHAILAFVVVACAGSWIIGGALVCSHGFRGPRGQTPTRAADMAELRARAEAAIRERREREAAQ